MMDEPRPVRKWRGNILLTMSALVLVGSLVGTYTSWSWSPVGSLSAVAGAAATWLGILGARDRGWVTRPQRGRGQRR